MNIWIRTLAAMLAMSSIGIAQAALQGRNLSGVGVAGSDPSAVFLYDTDRNITWLRDANYAETSGFDPDGRMEWSTALGWADGLTIGSWSDWRLPTALNADGSPPCSGFTCSGSEMGHFWFTELGNSAGFRSNSGDFQNLQFNVYWSGTEQGAGGTQAWYFGAHDGGQNLTTKVDLSNFQTGHFYAMAVRDGDVTGVVQEPQTYALLLAGMVALLLERRRQSR